MIVAPVLGLHFDFCLLWGLELPGMLWFCLDFPLDAGSVLRPGILVRVVRSQASGHADGSAEQLVQPGGPAYTLRVDIGTGPRYTLRLSWPQAAWVRACSKGR